MGLSPAGPPKAKDTKNIVIVVLALVFFASGVVLYFVSSRKQSAVSTQNQTSNQENAFSWDDALSDDSASPSNTNTAAPAPVAETNINQSSAAPELGNTNTSPVSVSLSNRPDVRALTAGTYREVQLSLTEDSKIEGAITLENAEVNLNGHSLTFMPSSRVEIKNSELFGAARDENEIKRKQWSDCVKAGKSDCGTLDAFRAPSGGIIVMTDNFVMQSSVIKNNAGHGLTLYKSHGARFYGSQIIDNNWNGIRTIESGDIDIEQNLFANNGCKMYSEYYEEYTGDKEACTAEELNFAALYFDFTDEKEIIFSENNVTGDVYFQGPMKNVQIQRNLLYSPSQWVFSGERYSGEVSYNNLVIGKMIFKKGDFQNVTVESNVVDQGIFSGKDALNLTVGTNMSTSGETQGAVPLQE